MKKLLIIGIISIFSTALTLPLLDANAKNGNNSGGNSGNNSGANSGNNSGGNSDGKSNTKSSDQISSKSNANKFDSNVRAKGLRSLKFLDVGKSSGKSFDSRLSAAVRFISRFDANGDGLVTKDETKNLTTKKFGKLNADRVGNITRTDLIAILSEQLSLETSVIFNALDKNKDGNISANESFNTHNGLVANGADTDLNGNISLEEYNNYNLTLSVEATVDDLDINQDGEISLEEMVTDVENQLNEIDTSQDGIISETDANL